MRNVCQTLKRKTLCVIGNALGIQEETYGPYAEGAHGQTKRQSCCDADKDKKNL